MLSHYPPGPVGAHNGRAEEARELNKDRIRGDVSGDGSMKRLRLKEDYVTG